MRQSFYVFCIILFASIYCFSQNPAQTLKTKEGYELFVELKSDKDTIVLGEPTYITFEIKTTQNLCPPINDFNSHIFKSDNYQIIVVRDAGKIASSFRPPITTSSWSGCFVDPMKDIHFVRKIFMSPSSPSFDKAGDYTITVKQKISTTNSLSKITNSLTAGVSLKLKVLPADNARIGEIIDSLGKRMLTGDNDAEKLFGIIDDKRTIKYHLQVLEKYKDDRDSLGQISIRRNSIEALGKYNDDSALEAIKNNMFSPNKLIREGIAYALYRSPHPKALGLLRLMRNDEDSSVRLMVVYGLGKIKTAESTAQLREMLNDRDVKIKTKAQVFLAERTGK